MEETLQFKLLLLDGDRSHAEWVARQISLQKGADLRILEESSSLVSLMSQEDFDLLLLDLDSMGASAVSLLRNIKQIRREQRFILLSSDPSYEQVLMALKEGALDFFSKPLDELSLVRVLQNHRYRIHEERFTSRIDSYVISKRVRMELPSDITLLPHAASRITEEVYAAGAIHPRQIYNLNLALFECLTNALEHGNLNIDYEDKTRRILEGDYLPMIQRMCRETPYRDRKIHVNYSITRRGVTVQVADEGEGFDGRNLLRSLESRENQDYHGRGLLLIKKTMDHIRFNDRGNRITFYLKKVAEMSAERKTARQV